MRFCQKKLVYLLLILFGLVGQVAIAKKPLTNVERFKQFVAYTETLSTKDFHHFIADDFIGQVNHKYHCHYQGYTALHAAAFKQLKSMHVHYHVLYGKGAYVSTLLSFKQVTKTGAKRQVDILAIYQYRHGKIHRAWETILPIGGGLSQCTLLSVPK